MKNILTIYERYNVYEWKSISNYKMILIFSEFDLVATFWINEENKYFNLNCYDITKYQIKMIYEMIEKIEEYYEE